MPVLHLEDVTGIPFLDNVTGIEEYQHRARVRASDGDLFAAGTAPTGGYEDYCRDTLGLGSPEFLQTEAEDPKAVARACFDSQVFDRLQQRASKAGGLVVHPYMAIHTVWELAAELAVAAGVPTAVLGPPPPVMWVANDKSHFCRVVEEALGPDWIVETRRATDAETLSRDLGDLSQRCDWVGLKRTRCASAMGNVVFDARPLRVASDGEIKDLVDEFLTRTQWCSDEEVLVVEWRETDLSPSTQLWLPPLSDGPPRMEGVYEQILEGPEKVFMGSRPSTLGKELNDALGQASMQVAVALQKMGYVGRCSFDFIVTGDPQGEFHAQFTECNGRWGGTSTPMHLVDRLVPHNGTRPAYIATDYYLPESHLGITFPELIEALHADLYHEDQSKGRFILYNVGPLKRGKFDVISLGKTPDDARRGLEEILPQRLGI